jgi:hypothetical protein
MTANAGYHAYATGDVLTAAQVQYNLQNQTVMYFATTTARDAALTGSILVDGMVAYTPATGVMVYNGSAWVTIGSTAVPTSYGFTAGKNAIINGAFNVWQRGTSFSGVGGYAIYNAADRFCISSVGASSTVSQQAFTYGTAPVAGYESAYFMRLATAASAMTYFDIAQKIEDVRTFAGQTVTMSFWAKSNVATTLVPQIIQQFGSSGSTQVTTSGTTLTTTTSWVRYSATIVVPSIAGKTIGAGSSTSAFLAYSSGTINSVTLDTWGWQVESGSTATSFQTATGTFQGELAACQRYYYRQTVTAANQAFGMAQAYSTTNAYGAIPFPVAMRTAPTALEQSGTAGDYRITTANFGAVNCTSVPAHNIATTWQGTVVFAAASGLVAGNGSSLQSTATNAYLGWSAEL